jgi:hypothetical protein
VIVMGNFCLDQLFSWMVIVLSYSGLFIRSILLLIELGN